MSELHYTVPASVQRLIKGYEKQAKYEAAQERATKFKLNEAVGRIAFFYEKIRNAVDYKEENLLVKAAIQRILNRRFVPGQDPSSIAEPLLSELIRGGYIPSESLPESIVEEIRDILNKYALFLNKTIAQLNQEQRAEVFEWSITMLACELENKILFSWSRQGMLEFVYLTLLDRIELQNSTISDDERKVQIFIAALRGHAQYDYDLTSYHLLKYFYPGWAEGKEDDINKVAANVLNVKKTLETQIKHPLQDRLIRQVKKKNVLFVIVDDVFSTAENPLSLLQTPATLDKAVEAAADEKYREVKSRLRRTSIRSIIYIFMTKIVIAVLLEVPYDYFFAQEHNYIPLAINVTFHPVLLFFIALFVHIPAKENTMKIIEGVKDLVYDYDEKDVLYPVRSKTRRGGLVKVLFRSFFTLAYAITFGVILITLNALNFNWVGMTLFIMFLTLVSFFGLRVRQIAKDIVVLDKKDNIISATVDLFTIPIVRAGHWLSINFAKVNVFVFLLDVIIEAPFKLILEVFEDWLAYIREKREELYN